MVRLASALSCLLLASVLSAQETRGTITGTVTDPSGAAVAGAKLSAQNLQTNTVVQGTTGNDGTYTIPYLLPGPYSITVEVQGFKKLVRQGIELRISERVNLDLRLEIGATQEAVNVTADAPLLEVSTATSGQVIDRRRIAELPLAEGNPMTLIQLAPGIVITGGYTSNSALSNSGPSNFEVNGSPGGNEYTLDGTPNTADRQGQGAARVGLQPPTDAVEEFKVVTAGFDAQQGRTAGGSIDVAVRSGTNEFHGSLYEFVRNDILMANSFFFNRQGRERQTRRYNRFGGTVGGPVSIPKVYSGKDRTFFFTSYERIRPITPALETLTVPTAAFRQGDFSSLLNRATPLYVYDPRTARVEGSRVVRDPIQCNGRLNVICPDRISPIARNYLSFLPLPNSGDASLTGNYSGNGPGDNTYDVFLVRLDHTFNQKHRIFGRYSQGWRTEIDENSAGTVNGVRVNGRLGHRGNKGGVIDYIFVPSATTVLNVRAGMTRFKQDRFSLASFDYDVTKMGFSDTALKLFTANTLPQINVSNFSSPVEPTGYLNTNPTWSFQPTLTRIAGSHSMRFGYDYRVYQQNRANQTYKAGQYNFANDFTRQTDQNPSIPLEQNMAQSMAALLLGQPTGGNFPLLADNAATAKYHSFFFQDDWKVARRLTLNLGLRYELDLGTTERYNRIIRDFDSSVPNPTEPAVRANYAKNPIPEIAPADFRLPGGLVFAGQDGRGFKADKNNFQPRIGAAYQINERTAIRGGWGMFMVPFFLDALNQNGFSRNTPLVASPDLGLTFTASLANPFPNGYIPEAKRDLASLVGQNPGTIVPVNRVNGIVQRWEVSLQRELPGRWLVEGAYIGNKGSSLTVGVDANPIPRKYQSTSAVRDQALINFLDTPVPNPFRGVAGYEGTNLYTASTIARSQLLRPYPQYTGLSRERYDGASTYNALQARVEKRFSAGYTILATYAWSKYLEQVSLLNPTDDRFEKRLSDADSPQRLAVSGIYELPFGRGRRFGSAWSGAKEALLGGFQLQGIFQYQAGRPLTLGNVYYNGNLSDLSPTIKSSTIGVLGSSNITDNVFLTNMQTTGFYFQDAAVQTNGQLDAAKQRNDSRINLSQNIRTLPSRVSNFRNQGITLLDISLIKNFAFTESVKLQFRAEAINSFNRAHFFGPVLNPRDANFGRVTNTDSPTLPREFQLGLRLVF
ncbi:MAG: TonB-dependent receptor [Bryobacteraceae bacterium]|nr:TonB-dependent receptor [Bryobacteraceae bacterium]